MRPRQELAAAFKAGSARTLKYHGRPCPKCAGTERYASNGTCVACVLVKTAACEPTRKRKSSAATARVKADPERHLRQRVRSMRASAARRGAVDITSMPSTDALVALTKAQADCIYCGVPLTVRTFSGDHAQPLSRGGDGELGNWRICCQKCNRAKGGMTEEEYRSLLALLSGWEDGGRVTLARLRMGSIGFRP